MYSVIIADDEKPVREGILLLGDWERLKLAVAGEAERGDTLCETLKVKHVDILIIDLHMPGIGGADLIKELCRIDEKVKIIIVSGFSDFNYSKQAIASRAVVDYILKPITGAQLNDALENAVKEIEQEKNNSELLNEARIALARMNVIEGGKIAFFEDTAYSYTSGFLSLPILERIKKYVDENYASKLTLQDLSGKFFLSEDYISKLFKKRFGVTLPEYIMSLRVSKAKEWLAENMKIIEIAAKLGFVDESHFSKVFKKYTGVSPRKFKGY